MPVRAATSRAWARMRPDQQGLLLAGGAERRRHLLLGVDDVEIDAVRAE